MPRTRFPNAHTHSTCRKKPCGLAAQSYLNTGNEIASARTVSIYQTWQQQDSLGLDGNTMCYTQLCPPTPHYCSLSPGIICPLLLAHLPIGRAGPAHPFGLGLWSNCGASNSLRLHWPIDLNQTNLLHKYVGGREEGSALTLCLGC